MILLPLFTSLAFSMNFLYDLCLTRCHAGRVAMLGFVAAIIGEKVTGKGPLTQVGIETGKTLLHSPMPAPYSSAVSESLLRRAAGIPLGQVSIFLVAFIAFFFFAAIFTGNIGETGVLFMQQYKCCSSLFTCF